MPCKHLDPDISVIVRCSFFPNRVCKQYIDADAIDDSFCEKQSKFSEPVQIDLDEREE